MPRPRKAPDLVTTHAFDPDWLAKFSMRGRDVAPPTQRVEPTAKDAALALAIVGRFTATPLVPPGDTHTQAELERMAELNGLRRGGRERRKASAHELMKTIGIRHTELLEMALYRVSECDVVGRRLLPSGFFVENGVADYTVDGPALWAAHPGKDKHDKPLVVDARKIAKFRCRHSVPIYLRALAWWRAGWRHADPDLTIRSLQDATLRAEMPVAAVPEMLGLDVRRWEPGEFTRVMRKIHDDIASYGRLDVDFRWVSDRRGRHTNLVVTVGELRVGLPVSGRPLRPLVNPFADVAEAEREV